MIIDHYRNGANECGNNTPHAPHHVSLQTRSTVGSCVEGFDIRHHMVGDAGPATSGLGHLYQSQCSASVSQGAMRRWTSPLCGIRQEVPASSSAVVSGTLPAGRRIARMAGSPTPLLSSTPSSVVSVSWQGENAMPSIHASARLRIVPDGYSWRWQNTPAAATRFAFT